MGILERLSLTGNTEVITYQTMVRRYHVVSCNISVGRSFRKTAEVEYKLLIYFSD